ncbi:hypothetical protein BH11ACT3_BH11ACT3_17010 [soil metagenome]
MSRTGAGTLAALVLLGAVAGFLLQLGLAAASQPKLRPEYTLAFTLLLIAVTVVVLAWPVRRATRASATTRVDPFYATRVVVLAKASALGGALLTGAAVGFVVEVLTRSGAPTTDAYLRVFATLGGAVALLIGGLVAEFLCRVPPRDDDELGPPPGPEHVHGG